MREDPERRYPLSFCGSILLSGGRQEGTVMKLSARNQLAASVAGITEGQINGLVSTPASGRSPYHREYLHEGDRMDAAEGGQAGLRRDQGYRGDGRRRAGENQCAESAAREELSIFWRVR